MNFGLIFKIKPAIKLGDTVLSTHSLCQKKSTINSDFLWLPWGGGGGGKSHGRLCIHKLLPPKQENKEKKKKKKKKKKKNNLKIVGYKKKFNC